MLYPIKFIPRLKERLWGGKELLATVKAGKGAKIDPSKAYGESWELSAVAGDESVVANGLLKKNNIEEIIEVYMGNLIGEKNYDRYGLTFPLLIKSLDCNDVLSVQVHPDDELAAERHNSYGKTEMWYVSGCKPGAALYVGFKNTAITREEYLQALNEDRLPEIMNRVEVKPGDVFFIPAGTIHALGKGCEVVEIQQTSDITYRVYDWNRVDDNGNPRELHTALAVDAIDFSKDGEACH
ncbi:MAG: class I mannose-6-phosphate isomerase, partial [Alistipes sp.]|nr:class I mannose-6-phosphate isomerase [Alistipes sp.]